MPAVGRSAASSARWGDYGTAGILLLVALLLGGLGGTGGVTLTGSVVYAARISGTPGLFTVEHCYPVGPAKQHDIRCTGTFRSDDGRVVDPFTTIGQDEPTGTRLPVQYGPDRTSHLVGAVPVAADLAGLCAALAALVLGLWPLLAALGIAAPSLGGRITPARERSGLIRPAKIFFLAIGLVLVALLAVTVVARIVSPY